MMVGYHGHGNLTNPEAFGRLAAWEQAFTYSKFNGANVDIGHFFAATGTSPAEWIKAHHDRVTHVHIKDRKANNGPNMPFGQGDTPIREILLMMKKEKYKFQATIEMEYPVPEGSTLLAEIGKCVHFCQDISLLTRGTPIAIYRRCVRHPPADSLSYPPRRRQRREPRHTGGPALRQRGHRQRCAHALEPGPLSGYPSGNHRAARRRGRRFPRHPRAAIRAPRSPPQAEPVRHPTLRTARRDAYPRPARATWRAPPSANSTTAAIGKPKSIGSSSPPRTSRYDLVLSVTPGEAPKVRASGDTSLHPPKVYSTAAIDNYAARLTSHYIALGYYDAKVNVTQEVRGKDAMVQFRRGRAATSTVLSI